MKIYTKSGDKGNTSLYGGKRVTKSHLLIETYGTVDECNAILGIAHSFTSSKEINSKIIDLQHQLFNVGADLATPLEIETTNRVSVKEVEQLELYIDQLESLLSPLKNFILPGGSKCSAHLHLARTVCRRAERNLVSLINQNHDEHYNILLKYLNRLSDYLFVLARYANQVEQVNDLLWEHS